MKKTASFTPAKRELAYQGTIDVLPIPDNNRTNSLSNRVSGSATEPSFTGPSSQSLPTLLKSLAPLVTLLIVYIAVFSYSHDSKVYLGGDNLTYFHLAKALSTGQGYIDITAPVVLPHNIYPPGYPFILSLFMRLGFTSLDAACMLNSIFGFACVLLSYLWAFQTTGNRALSFVVGFFLLLNGHFICSSFITMSEVPSLFFVMLAMYLMTLRLKDRVFHKDIRFALLLLCAVTAYHIRTSAMMLLPAILLFYALRKQWVHTLALGAGFVIGILPWMLRTAHLGGNSYMKQFQMKNPYQVELGLATMSDYVARTTSNIARYISSELPSALLQEFFPDLEVKEPTTTYWMAGILMVSLIIFGIIRSIKKNAPATTYLLLSAGVILCWPSVWFGSRFLVPLMPFILFMLVYGTSDVLKWTLGRLRLGWNPMILCLGAVFMLVPFRKMHAAAEEDYPIHFQSYFTAAAWAKSNMPANSVVACRKPEIFYHFSNGVKCVMYPFEPDNAKMLESFRKNKVTHVVIDQLGFGSTPKYLLPAIQNNAGKFNLIYQGSNPPTYIATFDPKK